LKTINRQVAQESQLPCTPYLLGLEQIIAPLLGFDCTSQPKEEQYMRAWASFLGIGAGAGFGFAFGFALGWQ
jgi:hypothetical protein